MPFFKINKVMQYTETVYLEADSLEQEKDNSGCEEGEINHDDSWIDATGSKITQEEYEAESSEYNPMLNILSETKI